MVGKGQAGQKAPNRQSAHIARKRAALIQSAQQVLADIGPDATIEQISIQANVSPTTIYNHFENKDALLREALDQMWRDWVERANAKQTDEQSFQSRLTVCRELFRVDDSDPLFAKVLRNTLTDPHFVIEAVMAGGVSDLREVAPAAGLPTHDFDTRVLLWADCIAGILRRVHVTAELTPADADTALGISLALWGFTPAKAQKLVSQTISVG